MKHHIGVLDKCVEFRRWITLDRLRDIYMVKVLDKVEWNRTHAGKILGVDTKTVFNNVRRLEAEGKGYIAKLRRWGSLSIDGPSPEPRKKKEERKRREARRGSTHRPDHPPTAKLTAELVKWARKKHFEGGVDIKNLSEALEVSEWTVRDFLQGDSWHWAGGPTKRDRA